MTVTLRRGDYFHHSKWLDSATNQPLECKVTKILHGCIYYRPVWKGHDSTAERLGPPSCFTIEQTERYVMVGGTPWPNLT